MPFSTDTTWPAGLRTIFDICRRQFQPLGDQFCAPYIKLLTYCFGDSFDFFVAPPPGKHTYCETNTIFLVVFNARGHPVLMAEINDDTWGNTAALRLKAEDQMHQEYNTMLADCPLPPLWGLSLLGTSLRVYTGDVATGKMEPAFTDCPSSTPPHDLLEGAWNIDILSQEGFDKMKEIVEDITSNAALERA